MLYCSKACYLSLPEVLHCSKTFHACMFYYQESIFYYGLLLICTLLQWSQYSYENVELKHTVYRKIVTLMFPYAVLLSLLLSSCTSRVRVADAGEVAKNKKHLRRYRVSFHSITCGNIHLSLWKSYKLYLTVPLFVATFGIHADDDSNLPLSPVTHNVTNYYKSVFVVSA